MNSIFIEKHKVLYKSLLPCYCLALEETVYFTAEGLNHILYYKRRPRNHNEKHYRMGLIPYLEVVIKNATTATKDVKTIVPLCITWSLEHEVKINETIQIVKVILKKQGEGKLVFLSVMSTRRGWSKKQKTP